MNRSDSVYASVKRRVTRARPRPTTILAAITALGGRLGSGWPLLFIIATFGNLIFLSLGFAIAGRVERVDAANDIAQLVTHPLMQVSGA